MKHIYFERPSWQNSSCYGFDFLGICVSTDKHIKMRAFISKDKVESLLNSDDFSIKAFKISEDDFMTAANKARRKKEEEYNSRGTYAIHFEPDVSSHAFQ